MVDITGAGSIYGLDGNSRYLPDTVTPIRYGAFCAKGNADDGYAIGLQVMNYIYRIFKTEFSLSEIS